MRFLCRAQASNGAADTSTEAAVDAEGDDESEEALEAKMQEFLRQQALQESGESANTFHLGLHLQCASSLCNKSGIKCQAMHFQVRPTWHQQQQAAKY